MRSKTTCSSEAASTAGGYTAVSSGCVEAPARGPEARKTTSAKKGTKTRRRSRRALKDVTRDIDDHLGPGPLDVEGDPAACPETDGGGVRLCDAGGVPVQVRRQRPPDSGRECREETEVGRLGDGEVSDDCKSRPRDADAGLGDVDRTDLARRKQPSLAGVPA